MKKEMCSFLGVLMFTGGIQLSARRVESKVEAQEAPKIVNFTQLAEYDLAHPVKKSMRYIEQAEDVAERLKFKPKPTPAGPVFHVELQQPTINERVEGTEGTPSPAPKISFNGTMDNGTSIPPDIQGAAGPTYLMETTNQAINIFTKTGTVNKSVTTATFFSASGGKLFFDPHVYYDPSYSRYIVCIAGWLSNNHSSVFVAVSQNNNPTGNWYIYSHDATGNTADLYDFPLLGYNTNWVVITGNDINATDSSSVAKMLVYSRAALYSGASATVTTFTDVAAFTLCPAQTQDINQTTEYLITNYLGNSDGTGFMEICTITGTVNAPSYNPVNTIGVNQAWSDIPVNPHQKGSVYTLEAGGTSVSGGAVFINGSLWFSHNAFLPVASPTHVAVDWWQIDPATPTLQQFGRIEDVTGATNYFYPCICANSLGDALLGYCQSGTNYYPSASYCFHSHSDASGLMKNNYITKAGVASYYKPGNGRNRYGDFTGTCVDAGDNSFWNFSEWANSGNYWGTYITNVHSSAVGIADQLLDNAIKVYPNPFNDNVFVTFGAAVQGNHFILSLTNSIGQTVAEKILSEADISEGYPISTSECAKGIYTLIIQNEQGRFIRKIIKE